MSLSKSEKVSAILAISEALKDQNWPVVDLTLDQFGFSTSDQWQGAVDAYVIKMVQSGSDEEIAALADHLGHKNLERAPPPEAPDPGVWRAEYFRLFISHISAERAFAAALQTALLQQGISGFVAHNDIAPTKAWEIVIESALATCDGLVALLHADFHASNWVDQEIGYVMGRRKHVSSVMLGSAPYGFIGKFQGFQGHGKTPLHLLTRLR